MEGKCISYIPIIAWQPLPTQDPIPRPSTSSQHHLPGDWSEANRPSVARRLLCLFAKSPRSLLEASPRITQASCSLAPLCPPLSLARLQQPESPRGKPPPPRGQSRPHTVLLACRRRWYICTAPWHTSGRRLRPFLTSATLQAICANATVRTPFAPMNSSLADEVLLTASPFVQMAQTLSTTIKITSRPQVL